MKFLFLQYQKAQMKRRGDPCGFIPKRIALFPEPQRELIEKQGWVLWPHEEYFKPRGSGLFHLKCRMYADLVRFEHPKPHWPPLEVIELTVRRYTGPLWLLLNIKLDSADLLIRAEDAIQDNHWPDFKNVKIKFRLQFLPRIISSEPWRWVYYPRFGFGRYCEATRFLELAPGGMGRKLKLGWTTSMIALDDVKNLHVPRIHYCLRYLAIVGRCNSVILEAFFFTWAHSHTSWEDAFGTYAQLPRHYARLPDGTIAVSHKRVK
jgi:hypothetical protein